MITAAECREPARSFKDRADKTTAAGKVRLLRNIAHSLSGLATQLDTLDEHERQLPLG